MDPVKTIGKSLDESAERDCIHVAIFPAIAAKHLRRGERVALVDRSSGLVQPADQAGSQKPLGIADPFFESEIIPERTRVWVFLFPGTVAGMRHHWTLPALDQDPRSQSPSKEEAAAWLRQFAQKWCFDYEDMVLAARERGGYVIAQGIDLHGSGELDEGDEDCFWECIETLTGERFGAQHRADFVWSCAC